MSNFAQRYQNYTEQIEKALPQLLPEQPPELGGRVIEAARYSLLDGGKRVRPVLALATADLLGLNQDKVMPVACAIEMIHTYSLIHDDLPCMDNDDFRRGRLTCHKVYGEAMAVLAGDTLLSRAAELLLESVDPAYPASRDAALYVIRAAGSQGKGMIGGQTLDLEAEKKQISADHLRQLHLMKTGALLKAPILSVAIMVGASSQIISRLKQYAEAIGLAFQIQDDILDVTADPDQLGKSTGKDQRDQKSTYVSLFGLEGARQSLGQSIDSAREALAALAARDNLDITFLDDLADFLLHRQT